MNEFFIVSASKRVGQGVEMKIVSIEDSKEAAEREAKRFEKFAKPIIDHIEGEKSLF